MKTPRFQCLCLAVFMTISPYTPQHFMEMAKDQVSVGDKIVLLRRMIQSFPLDASSNAAREQLVSLLAGTNRMEEAFQEYGKKHRQPGSGDAIDFTYIEYLLKTGRYNDVLRATVAAAGPKPDLQRDERLVELRVQALLAQGRFRIARQCVEQWLERYAAEGAPGTRFEIDVRSIEFLRRHLATLERIDGPEGKALFTASVPDSLQHWSHRPNVPVVFFKLIPTHPAGQLHQPVLPGRYEPEAYFQEKVDAMNRGFEYLSGGDFSLSFQGVHTLYVKEGDIDPASSGGNLLTSRVYAHTIPQLYRLAGDAFVILVDYRAEADGEAAYMGDGIVHLSASKLLPLVMIHEVLHGLGATHQEWTQLERQGYQFDPQDRGIMTFEHGELIYLGLEEKNRALLGWPRVAVVRLGGADIAQASESMPPAQPVERQVTSADGLIQKI